LTTLFTHIKQLVNATHTPALLRGKALAELPVLEEAFLLIEDDRIADFGYMYELELKVPQLPRHVVNLQGQLVLPAWCDSHTHLVFAGSRENEFVDKIQGLSYAAIAAKGGGILNSAKALQQCSEDELFAAAWLRLQAVAKMGTGAIEIKSGYGLTVADELKILRVIKRLKVQSSLQIKASFLGAHSYPAAYQQNHEEYINSIIQQMLPAIAAEKLADFIDVFCETGFFSPEEMERICLAGKAYGLKPKLHVNQLNSIGGLQKAIALDAISADHLETMTTADIKALAASKTIGTLLPTAAFFLRMPYQPARQLIESNCVIALASDYNPGSSPSGNMNFVVALSCIQLKMLPQEAINAATINGAYAMQCQQEVGSISIGKRANLIITSPLPSFNYLPYSFGQMHIEKVMLNGEFI
jgi:imidazolonepropionase